METFLTVEMWNGTGWPLIGRNTASCSMSTKIEDILTSGGYFSLPLNALKSFAEATIELSSALRPVPLPASPFFTFFSCSFCCSCARFTRLSCCSSATDERSRRRLFSTVARPAEVRTETPSSWSSFSSSSMASESSSESPPSSSLIKYETSPHSLPALVRTSAAPDLEMTTVSAISTLNLSISLIEPLALETSFGSRGTSEKPTARLKTMPAVNLWLGLALALSG
mmetsp:Transcript_26525/g.71061  ORF Transcript_26525/g.71061 Transcript_26525/m.71061 type:complete len:226 (-) Transcript_26525:1166-1843(-)